MEATAFSNCLDQTSDENIADDLPDGSCGNIKPQSSEGKDPQNSYYQNLSQDCPSQDIYKRYNGEWYNGNRKTPVFSWTGKRFLDSTKVCKYLLEPAQTERVCVSVPCNIAHNTSFMIDLRKLSHPDDWRSDDLGSWKHNGKHSSMYSLLKDGIIEVASSSSTSKNLASYELEKRYYKNKTHENVRKCVSYIKEYPNLIFVQYVFQSGETQITPTRGHLNARGQNQLYVRKRESFYRAPRDKIPEQKTVCSEVKESMEEIVPENAATLESPQSYEQTPCRKRKHEDAEIESRIGYLVVILEQCKRQQVSRQESLYIQEVMGTPELRSFLCYDWQLQEIAQFCTNPTKFSVFNVDSKLNIGGLSLAVTTYRNLKVIERKSGQHPTMIGPVFISQTNSFEAYHYFASKMVSLSKECSNILVYGTNGDEALSSAMSRAFPQAIHLRCFNHFQQICTDKLRSLGVPEAEQKIFLKEIFGHRVGDVFQEGLLDAESEESLEVKLNSFEKIWNAREKMFLTGNKEPSFHKYFSEQIDMISTSMLKEVRVNAGLGDPPTQYYNNSPDLVHAAVKRVLSLNESEMLTFYNNIEELIRHQKSDVERAIINKGPYKLADSHKGFQLSASKWFKISIQERETFIKGFRESTIEDISHESAINSATTLLSGTDLTLLFLSMNPSEAGITTIPPVSTEEMFREATDILSRPNALVPAPGSFKNAFMVENNISGRRPYFVTYEEGSNRVTCDDCRVWISFKICSHALAVAEKFGKLKEYLQWYNTNGTTVQAYTGIR